VQRKHAQGIIQGLADFGERPVILGNRLATPEQPAIR
jgi:hypothetical protein